MTVNFWRIRFQNGHIDVPYLAAAPQWKNFVRWVQQGGPRGTSTRGRIEILDKFDRVFGQSREMWDQWEDVGFDDGDDNNEAPPFVVGERSALQRPPTDANGWTVPARHAPPQIVAGSHRPPPPQVNLQHRPRPQHMQVQARMRPHPNPNMPPPQPMPAGGVGEIVTMCNELSPEEQRAFRAQHGANCIMTIHRVDDTGPRRTVTMRTVMGPQPKPINVDAIDVDEEEEEQDDDDDETVIDQDENNDDDEEEEEYYL